MHRVDLILIDFQVGFCEGGNLPVEGANEDAKRVAAMIDRLGKKITNIHLTMDSHHPVHIATPMFWLDQNNRHPDPFTTITRQEVEDGVWRTARPFLQKHALEYVRGLERNNRYELKIWFPHCEIGSPDHNFHPEIFRSVRNWEIENFRVANILTKGSNPLTEWYSAIKADFPLADDPTTQINTDFVQNLMDANELLFGGQALNFCLANTFLDIINEFKNDDYVRKCSLLTDGSSEIKLYPQLTKKFMDEATSRGMKLTTTEDYLS